MSYSRHSLPLLAPLRDVRLNNGAESLISERAVREKIEESYRTGFEAGQKALAEQLVVQRKQLLDLQTGVLRAMEKALPTLIADCEQSLILLALEAARKVVQQMPIEAALVEKVVQGALHELQDTADYEVLLHPEDLALLRNIQSGILPAADNTRVRFIPDSGVQQGDCVVNTRHGSIAAVREHMFDKLESAVLC